MVLDHMSDERSVLEVDIRFPAGIRVFPAVAGMVDASGGVGDKWKDVVRAPRVPNNMTKTK